jgi:hypothetical protein
MREEFVTISIINHLKLLNFCIVSFDYPQSGTGKILLPNDRGYKSKNEGGIIPDIVCIKGGNLLIFENKVNFFKPDIDALLTLTKSGKYTKALHQITLTNQINDAPCVGVGLRDTGRNRTACKKYEGVIDFAIFVNESGEISIGFDRRDLFS